MKIPPVEAELFHADGEIEGRTDMTKLVVAFRDFTNAPKNYTLQCAEAKWERMHFGFLYNLSEYNYEMRMMQNIHVCY